MSNIARGLETRAPGRIMDGLPDHAKGLIIVVLGVLVLTPDTLLIRLIALDPWTVLVWRGLLQALGLTVLIACFYGRGTVACFRAVGLRGYSAALLFAVSTVLFIVALAHTSVANTLIIVASAPFFAALASRVFLGERIAGRTWAAILAALGGIFLLAFESLGRGSIWGDLAALGVAVAMGGNFTVVRHARAVNMIPAMALSGLIVGLAALLATEPVVLDQTQLAWMLVMGLFVVPVSFALITLGPRYLPAPEVSLLLLLETVLGPFWVWLALGEAPGPWALAGGAVVVATLAVHSALALGRRDAAA
jgi:drug/metabolite transporter (DMT)-like permease